MPRLQRYLGQVSFLAELLPDLDNTFSLKTKRFKAPRDLRVHKIDVRFDHKNFTRAIGYSELLSAFSPDDLEKFICAQLDRVALAHSTFTPDAIGLIARSSEGKLRATRNLCIGGLMEAVRDKTRVVDLKQVNRVLLQPHGEGIPTGLFKVTPSRAIELRNVNVASLGSSASLVYQVSDDVATRKNTQSVESLSSCYDP